MCSVYLVFLRISAHRNILLAANDYFKAMFSPGMKEHGQSEISIHCVDGDIMQQLIESFYSGTITIDSDNMQAMMMAAAMLQCVEVQTNCGELCLAILDASNCLGIRQIADLNNMTGLKEAAHAVILDHFEEVAKGDEFKELDVNELCDLLKDSKLRVNGEQDVFNAMIEWIRHDVAGRKHLVERVLDHIRFQYITNTVSESTGV